AVAERQVAEAVEVAETRLSLGNAQDTELIKAARKAEVLLATSEVSAPLRQRVGQVLADLAMVAELGQIRLGQTAGRGGHFDLASADAAYARAFRSYGIDVEALAPEDAAARIRERTIAMPLAAALDNWARALSPWGYPSDAIQKRDAVGGYAPHETAQRWQHL